MTNGPEFDRIDPRITKRENEEPPVTGSKLKCPHCGSDQLILLEQLPRPLISERCLLNELTEED
jgi:hypothetical protein